MAVTLYPDGSFIITWEGCRNIDVILQARDFECAESGFLKTLVSARLKREEAWRFGNEITAIRKCIVRLAS